MNHTGKLYARVGDKGSIAFVRFDAADYSRHGFTIVWSCGGDHLSTGETGFVHEIDINAMVDEGTLFEISESTDLCPKA